ncbi:phytanoyl-CoA dioxygenase [Rhexocercosporidium sp. MPI-PUGE-AT-0058]|nr:phytanoyl-CoA dioxygenase [Rhexocercosporidium sp. MPI-PUGE-AT-0058]
MAPIALSSLSSPATEVPPIVEKSFKPQNSTWLSDLQKDGYVVVRNVIPRERAIAYQQKAFDWISTLRPGFDVNNPDTWIKKNLPFVSEIHTFYTYGIAHEKFMWNARMEPGVLKVFEELWGTSELLASFDALNVTFPNRKDIARRPAWEHIDQSPLRRGLQCVQGIISLSHAGPEDGGLMCYPGSHLLSDEFFDTQTDKTAWRKNDFYGFTKTQLEWFTAKGLKPLKVCAEPGDLILWDSRTIHYGAEPTEASNTIRTIIYAAYTPAKWATKEALEVKADIFKHFLGTTHWPHENLVKRNAQSMLEDGTRDPKDRDEPFELPKMTPDLLKLAGAKSY